MPTKKIKTIIKLNIPAGEATPAPPIGPALGQHGLPIMDFCRTYNEQTKNQKGNIIPVVITVYEDRTFSFVTQLTPVSEMLKKALKIEKGSGKAGKEEAGILTKAQAREIAQKKLKDLNCGDDLDAAQRIVEGAAKSMGVTIK